VDVLLEGEADEFIPKDVPWIDILKRVRHALERRRDKLRLAAASRPILSNVARTSAEDLQQVLSRTRSSLTLLATDVPETVFPRYGCGYGHVRDHAFGARFDHSKALWNIAASADTGQLHFHGRGYGTHV